MGLRETPIQQAVLVYLQMLENQGKLYFCRNNSFSGHITRANGSRGYIKNNKKGAPDIICCIRGQFVGVEIKAQTAQSADQKAAQRDLEAAGGVYLLVRSVDELISKLEELL